MDLLGLRKELSKVVLEFAVNLQLQYYTFLSNSKTFQIDFAY